VLFKPLTLGEITSIVDLLLEDVRGRLIDRGLKIEVTDAAKAHIAQSGYDPVYGARPLKRFIQRELETKVGRALIADELQPGGRIMVDLGEQGLTISTANGEERHEAA
jgi:ATP-dependent Clp protease ATP-binding subunit ClpB